MPIRGMLLLALLLSVFASMLPLHAQSDNASISGTVTDASGAVVPRATITVTNEATNQTRTATSGDSGSYTITNLPPGSYTVSVEAKDFKGFHQTHNHLQPSIGLQVDCVLQVGSSETTISVVADSNVIQTQTAAVGQLVTEEQVKNIQLNGRNPMYLAQLEPGVRRGSSISNFNFGLDNGININGSNNRENGMTFDGAPMVRSRGNGDAASSCSSTTSAVMSCSPGSSSGAVPRPCSR